MAGTHSGGLNTAETNKRLYGNDYYERLGELGGKAGKTGGFAAKTVGIDGMTGKERARLYGSKGGKASRRGKETGIRQSAKYYHYDKNWKRWVVKYPEMTSESFLTESEAKEYVAKLRGADNVAES